MKKDLLPVVVAPSSLLSKLVASVIKLQTYQDLADTALSSLLRDDEDLLEKVKKVERCNAELVARTNTVDSDANKVRLSHGVQASVRNLIDANFSTGIDLVQREQARAYYRKLVRKHHPDRGGMPDNFHAVQQAYQSANFPLLYLYLWTESDERPDDEVLEKTYNTVLHSLDVYTSQPSFIVLKNSAAGRKDLAVQALNQALDTQLANMTARLHGYVPLNT